MNYNFVILNIVLLLMPLLGLSVINILLCSQGIDDLVKFLPLSNLIMVVLILIAIKSIKQVLDTTKAEVEATVLKQHLNNVQNLVQSLHATQHEYTRHIQTLQSMLYLGKYENATEYVDGITHNYTPMQEVIYVGDPALTSLLHTKTKVAETEGIDFNFAIKCDLDKIGLNMWDLCSIVGNLLDNAFDACLSSGKEKRVSLEIKSENQNYSIIVTNTGKKIPKAIVDQIFEPGFTTKKSKARGFGLFIVQNIVKDYGGNISIVYEPKTVFIVSIPDRS